MTYRLQIGTASRICTGQAVCGDQSVVLRIGREVFIAVADGLGHGPEAHEAARVACSYIEDNRISDMARLLREIDRALARTRGAAVTVVWVDTTTGDIRHAGVGNVQLMSYSKERINPYPTPGVLGARVRKILASRFQLNDGDFFVIYTDGISSHFHVDDYAWLEPQMAADQIIGKWAKSYDDATCVTVKVRN